MGHGFKQHGREREVTTKRLISPDAAGPMTEVLRHPDRIRAKMGITMRSGLNMTQMWVALSKDKEGRYKTCPQD